MKLIRKNISVKDGSGNVIIKIDTPEDLWHAYNLLQTHDRVRCTTLRKVVKESSTGSTVSNKKRLSLTIEVLKVFFDPDTLEVRLSGPNREESAHVRLGAHHTLTLKVGIQFTLEKACWDQIYLDRLEESTQPERNAEVAAVVMNLGLCHVCLVTEYLTIVKAKIEVPIPKKRGVGSTTNHAKAITRFFEAVYQAVVRHVDFAKVKCCLIASPGFVKDDFFQYLMQKSERNDDRVLLDNRSKFVLCKASSGHKHALDEVLQDPTVVSQMADTKMAEEVEVLQRFMRMIDTHPDQAQYGFFHVQKACELGAVESLLVTDELFRGAHDPLRRKKYVQLVEDVRASGGRVYVFSSLHVSGTQLQQVSGVAAILRFPLPELADLEEDDDSDNDSEGNISQTWSSSSSFDSDAGEDVNDDDDYDDEIDGQTRREAEDVAGMGL